MKNVKVIATIYILFPVLIASKPECTDYYIVFKEGDFGMEDSTILTRDTIDWASLKNQSKDAYDEIHSYSHCILELDCLKNDTKCIVPFENDISIKINVDDLVPPIEYETLDKDDFTTIEHMAEFESGPLNKYNKTCINNKLDGEICLEHYTKTLNNLKDFNVSLIYGHNKNLQNATIIDITNLCNSKFNNDTNQFSLICDNIDSEANTITPEDPTRHAKDKAYTKPENFSVILFDNNRQCTANGTELDITNNCLKVTSKDDVNSTFSLVCQFEKDNCANVNSTRDIDKRIRKNNQTATNFNSTYDLLSLRLDRAKKEKKNKLVLYLVAGFVGAASGVIALAAIALKSVALQAGSFQIPDNPPYTHPEFRDDVEETLF